MSIERSQQKRERLVKFSKFMILFFAVSFCGWFWETLYFFIFDHELLDRGFLTTPICPIYGISILLIYFLLGTPNEGRCILKKVKNKFALIALYFLLAMAIPTVLELFVGWVFDYFFHTHLWTYKGNWMNFRGYISPSMSLFWGISLTLIMKFVFPPLKNLFMKIPDKVAVVIGVGMAIVLSIDSALCLTAQIRKRLSA